MAQLPPDAPRLRVCDIRKAFPEQEYGFNLHAERGRGQFIGNVDPESPAAKAGLMQGDWIVAVNDESISQEDHKRVVQRIKEDPLHCKLLVIDVKGKEWYEDRKIPITSDLPTTATPSPPSHRPEKVAVVAERPSSSPAPPPYSPVEETQAHARTDLPSVRLRPRFCVLKKTHETDEYGFNLHAEKGKGHFIGKVDPRSIAQLAGLEEGQRIVGVNGTLIYPSTVHKEVVTLIRKDGMRTELLVATPEVDRWFANHEEEFSFDDAEVFGTASPHVTNGHVSKVVLEEPDYAEVDRRSKGNEVTVISVTATPTPPTPPMDEEKPTRTIVTNGDKDKDRQRQQRQQEEAPKVEQKPAESPKPRVEPVTVTHPRPQVTPVQNGAGRPAAPIGGGLDVFNKSAAEVRQALQSRRNVKAEAKKENMTLQQKHQIVDNL